MPLAARRAHTAAMKLRLCWLVARVFQLALAAVVLGAACRGASPPAKLRPSLLEDLASTPSFRSPARWEFHPREMSEPLVTRVVTETGTLLVAAEGERWWIDRGQDTATVADELAPEPLAGAIEIDDGWLFVGRSGTTYETRLPLGPFLRSSAPPEALVRVTVGRETLLGVDHRGRVQRSDDLGLTWIPMDVGSKDAHAVDVALLPSGHGLALFAPEQLWVTADHAQTFEQVDFLPFGAVALHAEGDRVSISSVLEGRSWYPLQSPTWRPRQRLSAAAPEDVKIPVGPSATALAEGRAVVLDSEYVEVQLEDSSVQLLRGPVWGPLQTHQVAELEGSCVRARLAVRGPKWVLTCAAEDESLGPVRIFASRDSGVRWRRVGAELHADFEQLRVAVMNDGALVVTGICPPTSPQAGCRPAGVYRLSGAGAAPKASTQPSWEPVHVPGLSGVPLALAAAHQGDHLYALGVRSKGDQVVLFVSTDGGQSFGARRSSEIELSVTELRNGDRSVSVEGAYAGRDGHTTFILNDQASAKRWLLVLDERGKAVSLSAPPSSNARVSASGLMALAFDAERNEAWESLDGGVSWQGIGRVPLRECRAKREACEPDIACHAQGCVIGDSLSRRGWKGQLEPTLGAFPPPRRVVVPAPREQVRSPISCSFANDDDWRKIAGGQLPTASQASIGEVQWYTFFADWRDASVTSYEVVEGNLEVIPTVLFDSRRAAAEYGLYASLQIEGMAALRASSEGVELAWRNLFEGRRTQRARLPAGVQVKSEPTRFTARVATPDLVSVAAGGLFVRPQPRGKTGPTYFFDGSRVEQLPPLSWRGDTRAERGEMLRVGERALGLKLAGKGAAVVLARLEQGGWNSHAKAVGLMAPEAFGFRQRFDLAYQGGRPHYHLMLLEGQPSRGWLFPFRADEEVLGAPIEVPSQAHLAAAPPVCSSEQRRATPRVVVPHEAGTRHPVMVTHGAEPIRTLLTGEAVLYGSPKQPCAAAFDAEAIGRSSTEQLSALVFPDAVQASWLFRRLSGSLEFEYRRMSCGFDPAAEVPAEVYGALNQKD